MASDKKFCKQCGQIMNSWMRNCPECNALYEDPADQAGIPPDAYSQGDLPEQLADDTPLPMQQIFPERMKANRVLSERACTGCRAMIELGDNVWNCQTCGNTMHQACRDQMQMCGNAACSSRAAANVPPPSDQRWSRGGPLVSRPPNNMVPNQPAGGETMPCRFCGELIIRKARKCRHCGEYQNDIDRNANTRRTTNKNDDSFTGNDTTLAVLSFLCMPCLGIVLGIVWMSQGKKKGSTMLLIGIVAFVIHAIVAPIISIFLSSPGGGRGGRY